jgi:hypothetical protein
MVPDLRTARIQPVPELSLSFDEQFRLRGAGWQLGYWQQPTYWAATRSASLPFAGAVLVGSLGKALNGGPYAT